MKFLTAKTLYLFIDEGGNFNFSAGGTKYFTLTCVSMFRPFELHSILDTYKYDLIETSIEPRIELEFFHCADDNRHIKDRVFSFLSQHIESSTVDSVIVEKAKTGPALRAEAQFYPRMLGYLIRYAIQQASDEIDEVVVITDSIPINRKRKAIEKAVKVSLAAMLPASIPYRVMHHQSRSHYGLQIADYFNWAIFRKWEQADAWAHEKVSDQIRSEFDIFRTGTTYYY